MNYLLRSRLYLLILLVSGAISLSFIPDPLEDVEVDFGLIGYRVQDVSGKIHRLGVEQDGVKPIACVFIDVECPISQRYIPTLNELSHYADSVGVIFYGIISDPSTSPKEAAEFQHEYAIDFPVLFDASGDIARQLKPKTLPQSYVLDVHNTILYSGRIDDGYVSPGKTRKVIRHHDLKEAIEAASERKIPASAFEEPIGCIFESWKSEYPENINYNRDIAPIVNANCVNCHRDGDIAPFSLEGYDNVKRRAQMIEYVTKEHYMPIWKPERGHGDFRDEHFLNDYQIELIKRWNQNDQEEGAEEERIPEPTFGQVDWKYGKPDKIVEMTASYTVPAKGEDIYRYFVVPDVFTEDKIIKALDFMPGAKEVVHHVIFLLDYSGKAREFDKKDPEPGFSVFDQNGFMQNPGVFAFGGWNPGTQPYILAENVGMYIPAGADVVMEIHYHLTGKEVQDKSAIAMYFADQVPEKFVGGLIMGTKNISIPPEEKMYPKSIWMEVPADFYITDITPHMHAIGQSIDAKVTNKEGTVRSLIKIDDWDLRWQNIYSYREPVFVEKGSIIEADFTFNNSSDNPSNPNNPAKEVHWGWGADDEMCELFMTFIPADPQKTGLIKRAALASWIHIDSLSENELISEKGIDQTARELMEVDIWSDKGQALLVAAYESDHVKDILTKFKYAERENERNQTFLTNFGVYVVLYIATKETTAGVFWDAYKANALFKNAIALDRKDWNARYSRAYSYVETQRKHYVKKGVKWLKKLNKKFPGNAESKYHRSYLSLIKGYKFLGKNEKAKAVVLQAYDLFPENMNVRQEHAILKYN